MEISRSARPFRDDAIRGSALLMAVLLLCGTNAVVVAPSAAARAVPTCQGVRATIIGTAGDNTLKGTAGNDVIFGGGGVDNIFGGAGDDIICGGPTRDKEIDGDFVYQELSGGDGDDIVVGGRGDDYIYGDLGADLLIGRAGSDSLAGDGGTATGGADVMFGGPGFDFLSGDRGNDRMYGGPGPDTLDDYEGANLLVGGDGPDVLSSGPGDETIRGGRDRDTVSYVSILEEGSTGSHCNDITADLSKGTAQGTGFGTDILQEIESVWTGGGSDVLIGDDGPNGFYTGGLPCDVQSPTDRVTGNGGVDEISFDSETSENGSGPGPVRVDLAKRAASWSNRGYPHPILLSLVSIENVIGTEYADVILGNAQPNSLSGGSGTGGDSGDLIRGRLGADLLSGFGGNDLLAGGPGPDRLLGESGNDRLYGGPDADVLLGSSGNDRLYGGLGADSLLGDVGNDRLYGGPGPNRNDGGIGIDKCFRPRVGFFAFACER